MTSIELAQKVREDVLEMAYLSKGSHIGSALSIIDILAVLYSNILNITPNTTTDINRDRFILSKGHAGSALYATLARKGFFNPEELKSHYSNGSNLSGHVSHKGVPGVEISTGSLGHGISIATGFALSAKIDGRNNKVFVIVGDGECNEGSVWESILFATQNKLDNLTIIIDKNKIQAMGNCNDIMNMDSLAEKFKSFNTEVIEINGHNHEELINAFEKSNIEKPKVIIANTVKGYGISFMENQLIWHYRNPNEEDYKNALDELRGEKK